MSALPVSSRKYDRIADRMHLDVLAGRFRDRLPGERVLSREYGVNFMTVRRAMARLLQEQGIGTLPVNPRHFQPTPEELQRILAYRPIGLIAGEHHPISWRMLNDQGRSFPRKVLWTDRWGYRHSDAVTLCCDAFQGLYRATRHLIALGHRRILFANHAWHYPEEERINWPHDRMCRGFERVLEEAGLSAEKCYLFLGADRHANAQAVREVFCEPAHRRPTGLIAYCDFEAVQVAREVRALGLRIPEDLALVGYNNTPWCQWNDVPLSSVNIREKELARFAAEAMTGSYPTRWEDLYRQRAVVLNNVPAKAVTIVGVLMLKEYLQDGGSLVVMGDTHGLAAGGWGASALSSLMPVTLASDNLVRAAEPLLLAPQTEALRKPGLDWSAGPCTLYYHPAVVKPEARVLVGAGDVPLVVEGPAGKGRVVVLLNAVLGERTPGMAGVPFWQWKDWPALMAAILADNEQSLE